MQESLEASLVHFHTADGRVIGAGFLVGERHILTCAHIVAGALELADDEPEKPQVPVSRRPGEIAEEAKETFEQAFNKIRPATEKVIHTLRGLAHKPDEIEMEFGFNMSAAAGVVIALASDESNYKVTLRRKQEEQKSNP